MRLKAASLVSALVIVGCAEAPPRVPRVLDAVDGVVFSSASFVNERSEPRARGKRLAFDCALLVENHGASVAAVDMVNAEAAFRDHEAEPFRVFCREHQQDRRTEPVAFLQPGERTLVECLVELSPEQTADLGFSDREMLIGVPLYTADHSGHMVLEYRLRAGDAR